jgi:hypothetical protein
VARLMNSRTKRIVAIVALVIVLLFIVGMMITPLMK